MPVQLGGTPLCDAGCLLSKGRGSGTLHERHQRVVSEGVPSHPMLPAIEEVVTCVRHLAPTRRKEVPLHGRWLDHPHLDEWALSVRWLILRYRWVAQLPDQPQERPLLPILLDTVYVQPFAVLLATVPCGSRGLPIAVTTYQRQTLEACFPPEATWPDPTAPGATGTSSASERSSRSTAAICSSVRW